MTHRRGDGLANSPIAAMSTMSDASAVISASRPDKLGAAEPVVPVMVPECGSMGEAMTTNPALAPLQFLAGARDMELSEASFLPDPDATVHGAVTFEWIEQGAALVMRMGDAATPRRPGSSAEMTPGRSTTSWNAGFPKCRRRWDAA